jgi:hypothetical protein
MNVAGVEQRPLGTSGLAVPVVGMGTRQTLGVRGQAPERIGRDEPAPVGRHAAAGRG